MKGLAHLLEGNGIGGTHEEFTPEPACDVVDRSQTGGPAHVILSPTAYQQDQPLDVVAHAWNAQHQLHEVFRHDRRTLAANYAVGRSSKPATLERASS